MKPRTLLTLVLSITAAAVTATVLPFLIVFKDQPFARTSSQPWGELGDYIGGVLGPVLAALNLFVVLYIAVRITDIQQNQLERKRLTLDLYNEWHTEAMQQSRTQIVGLISQAQQCGTGIPAISGFDQTDPSRSPHAHRVFHFFQKWALLRQEGELDDRVLNAVLERRASWWNTEFLTRLRQYEKDPHTIHTLDLIDRQVSELQASLVRVKE